MARFSALALAICIAPSIASAQSTPYIYTVAGTGAGGYSGDGSAATAADIDIPSAVTADGSGNLYIADEENNVIRKVAAGTGVMTTVAGTGIGGYSGDGGPATSAELWAPRGVAVDGAGNLYITDSLHCVLRKVSTSTNTISTVAGNGTCAFAGDNGPAISAQLNGPDCVAIDSQGNLYLCDNNSIREVKATTGIITTVAGGGGLGYAGDGGPAIGASLNSPMGVAVDRSGNLYIADCQNDVIRKVTASNGIISTVAGNANSAPIEGYGGDGGPATSAKLDNPFGVAVDSAGNLYIADTINGVVREVAASNGVITTFAGDRATLCSSDIGDAGPATAASLCYVYGVAIDVDGDLFLAEESDRIREVPSATPPTSEAATPTFSVLGGTYPGALTVAISDTTPGAAIYVTLDGSTPTASSEGYSGPISVTGNVTIRAVAAAPGFLASQPVTASYTITSSPSALISTVAGDGTKGFSGASGPATNSEIGAPIGLALDGAGNLYIADWSNNIIWRVAAKTGTISVVAGTGTPGFSGDGGAATAAELNSPEGVAVDSSGNLYIADSSNNRIRKVVAATGVISTVAGNGTTGQPLNGMVGDGGPATSGELFNPAAVVVDAAGNLYIADTSDNLVRYVSASTGIITTIAGLERFVTNYYAYIGDGGPATNAYIPTPNSLALDGKGNLYIPSANLGRIRKLNLSTGIITTVAGNGDALGNSGDRGPALSAEIYPESLAVDSQGNLYFSALQSEIRVVSAATGLINRVAGTAYWGYSGDGGSATIAELDLPCGIVIDSDGNLYIADEANSRVRKVTFPGTAPMPIFSLAAGTYTGAQTVRITDGVSGAAIYYTTDGSVPTPSSAVYTTPITISQTETLQAIAIATGYVQSAVASATYTISVLTTTPTVTVSPTSSSITTAQSNQVTVTVNGGNGNPTPTGSVTLSSGSYNSGATALSGGSATITVPAGALAVGSDTLTATYGGDSNYNTASGTAPVTVTQSTSCSTGNPNLNPNPAASTVPSDFNGDCKSDILWRNSSSGQAYTWFMNGTALSSSSSSGTAASPWAIQGIGDFDGDGKADILWRNTSTGQVYIWLMNGSTLVSSASPGTAATAWVSKGVGDFNGDGKSDILWQNTSTGQVYVWLMNGTAFASSASPGTVGSPWAIKGVGDFNGDGKADILWQSTTTGQVYVWLMNGTALSSSGTPGTAAAQWQIFNQ